MNQAMAMALLLAVTLIIFGLLTAYVQFRGLRVLASRKHVPSDEFQYLRRRYIRRLLTGTLLVLVGVLLALAYVSGLETQADALAEPRPQPVPGEEKPKMSDDQKQFLQMWAIYWIVVIMLVFGVLLLAFLDALATRRYWLAQYRNLREEHHLRLRRDLAVHRQHQDQQRTGRRGGASDPPTNIET